MHAFFFFWTKAQKLKPPLRSLFHARGHRSAQMGVCECYLGELLFVLQLNVLSLALLNPRLLSTVLSKMMFTITSIEIPGQVCEDLQRFLLEMYSEESRLDLIGSGAEHGRALQGKEEQKEEHCRALQSTAEHCRARLFFFRQHARAAPSPLPALRSPLSLA